MSKQPAAPWLIAAGAIVAMKSDSDIEREGVGHILSAFVDCYLAVNRHQLPFE